MSMIADSTGLYGGPQVQLLFTNRNFFLQIITFFYKPQLFYRITTIFHNLAYFFTILLFFLKSCNFFLQILQFNIATLSQLRY